MDQAIELGQSQNASLRDSQNASPRDSLSFQSVEEPLRTTSLAPVDKGLAAWTFLAAATMLESLVWGLPFSVGVLHTYWTTEMFPPGTPGESLVTVAATLQTGLMYMLCLVFGPLLAAYPHRRLQLQLVGLAGAVVSLISTAFVTKPWQLLLSLGLTYPLSALMYMPAATLIFEWFHTRRGLASGILYAGTGAGGTVFPFIMQGLLRGFGYKVALISLGIGYGIIAFIAILFIKPRVPIPRQSSALPLRRRIPTSFLGKRCFYAFAAAILLTSMGNFIPGLFIPTFADQMGVISPNGTALLALLNASSVFGTLIIGYLCDHLPLPLVISISCLGSAFSCLFLWGFATNTGVLVAFAILFGLLGPSFTAIWAPMVSMVAKDDPNAQVPVFSLFAFARGIGNFASGPISTALLGSSLFAGGKGAYGLDNYGALILYVGSVMIAGSVVGVTYRLP